jgi:hypothetical protein
MNMPRIIRRWFSHDLPPYDDALRAARAAKRPWASEAAYAAFASVDETQGEGMKEKMHA